MLENFDVFISYKTNISLATANNLYYRLTTRGYSTFLDLDEMRRDNFEVQLFSYIENAKDVFILLEEGSLDACKVTVKMIGFAKKLDTHSKQTET